LQAALHIGGLLGRAILHRLHGGLGGIDLERDHGADATSLEDLLELCRAHLDAHLIASAIDLLDDRHERFAILPRAIDRRADLDPFRQRGAGLEPHQDRHVVAIKGDRLEPEAILGVEAERVVRWLDTILVTLDPFARQRHRDLIVLGLFVDRLIRFRLGGLGATSERTAHHQREHTP
jgi:hypothetical protein